MPKIASVVVVVGLAAATPALADPAATGPEILERDAQGNVTRVRINGKEMDVCTSDKLDGCINPRDAGLDQGNREIEYWPGKPASEIEGSLPVEKPQAEQAGQNGKDAK